MSTRSKKLLLLGVPTLYLVLLFILPIISLIALSFWRTESYHIIREWNVQNYVTVLTEPAYLTFLGRSIVVSLAVSAVGTLIGWVIAYAIWAHGGRFRLLLALAFAVPFFTGEVLRVIALQGLLGPLGLINGTLMAMGFAPIRALMYSNFATGVGLFYLYMPIIVTVIYLSLLNLDRRLIDAARIFGASTVRSFIEVTWPLNTVGTLIAFALCFIPCMSATLAPRFLGGPNGTLYGMAMAQQFGESGTWALGAAMGVVLFIFSLLSVVLIARSVDLRRTGFTGFGRS